MTNFMYGAAGLLLCLLPAGGLALVFVIFRLRGEGWRSSIIASATCNALYVAFSTEILSVFRLITRPGLATAWVVFDAACFFYIRNLLRKKTADGSLEGESTKTSYTPTLLDVCLLAGVSLVVGLVGLTAILAPTPGMLLRTTFPVWRCGLITRASGIIRRSFRSNYFSLPGLSTRSFTFMF